MPSLRPDGPARIRGVAALALLAVALPLAVACGSSQAAPKPTATATPTPAASSARARPFANRTPRTAALTAIAEGTRPAAIGAGGFGGANITGAVATLLAITPAELQKELAASGATLATVAAAHGKDRDALKQALITSMQQRLNTAVANGTITQAASEQTLTQFQSRIDALVDSKGGTTMRSFRTPTPGT
jgi:hypothetical protein